MNKPLNIRDLQRISAETISTLAGPTAVKAGARTVAILIPIGKANKARFKAALATGEEWAKGRDIEADDKALEAFGPVERFDYPEAVDTPRKRSKRKK